MRAPFDCRFVSTTRRKEGNWSWADAHWNYMNLIEVGPLECYGPCEPELVSVCLRVSVLRVHIFQINVTQIVWMSFIWIKMINSLDGMMAYMPDAYRNTQRTLGRVHEDWIVIKSSGSSTLNDNIDFTIRYREWVEYASRTSQEESISALYMAVNMGSATATVNR